MMMMIKNTMKMNRKKMPNKIPISFSYTNLISRYPRFSPDSSSPSRLIRDNTCIKFSSCVPTSLTECLNISLVHAVCIVVFGCAYDCALYVGLLCCRYCCYSQAFSLLLFFFFIFFRLPSLSSVHCTYQS